MRSTLIKATLLCLAISTFSLNERTSAGTDCPGIPDLTDPLAIRMDNGETVIWDKIDSNLIAAKVRYENLIKQKNWKIVYTSAYRPLQYQQHFYNIIKAPASACKSAEIKKHGLVGVVATPNPNAPHVKGIAFDAIVTDKNGITLNGRNFVNPSLIAVASQAGLKFPLIKTDGVHHELATAVKSSSKKLTVTKITTKKMNAIAKITTKTGFNVRKSPSNTATKLGFVRNTATVHIVAINGEWYKIRYSSGYGYVKAVKGGLVILSKEKAFKAQGKIIAPSGLNIRTSINVKANKIGTLKKGDTVIIVSTYAGWYKIKQGKSYGYVMGKYVKI